MAATEAAGSEADRRRRAEHGLAEGGVQERAPAVYGRGAELGLHHGDHGGRELRRRRRLVALARATQSASEARLRHPAVTERSVSARKIADGGGQLHAVASGQTASRLRLPRLAECTPGTRRPPPVSRADQTDQAPAHLLSRALRVATRCASRCGTVRARPPDTASADPNKSSSRY